MTFRPEHLNELHDVLRGAYSVVAMRDIAAGNQRPDVIGLRHDVDDNSRSFETAMNMARWEAKHGFRSTYFVLHSASYWNDSPFFRAGLEEIALAGHEIGIHSNAITVALQTGGDPHVILYAAIETLREWGHAVVGVASHGDPLCHDCGYVNYDQFLSCARERERKDGVDPFRTLVYNGYKLPLDPALLSDFELKYETYHLQRGAYLSDTGGSWNWTPGQYNVSYGQLHILQHSDWWADALSPLHEVA